MYKHFTDYLFITASPPVYSSFVFNISNFDLLILFFSVLINDKFQVSSWIFSWIFWISFWVYARVFFS
ncbi:hypothetical protein RCL_jg14350.t1 [Rhizophagus clarus]|uniref:Uncharacterized protein n=1 Tax=Rhizophagus clarus TaxID=94130 RepID=A0A8H3LT08_9GLOM|nr:hypothetical protein RCL_jg14350.t1 [Rhizophagus clarus]